MSKKRISIIAIICTILTLLLFILSQKQYIFTPLYIKETSSRLSNNETISSKNETINSKNETITKNETSTKNESMENYMNELLFNSNKDLISYFKDANDYIPLYNIDSFRRSRGVYGDISRLRRLLNRLLLNKNGNINILTIGGSITVGHGVGINQSWPYHLHYWFNNFFPNLNIYLDNKPTGAVGPSTQFWLLSNKLNYNIINNTIPYDLIIMELSTNTPSGQEVWIELIIRNLLLIKNKPCIIILDAQQGETKVIGKTFRSDLIELYILNYYQIPTVSIPSVIYPLSFRYYLNNYILNISKTHITKRLYATYPQLAKLMFNNDDNNNNNNNNDDDIYNTLKNIYHDERYSYEPNGKHLRIDDIHPTLAGQKYLALELIFLFVNEINKLLFDKNKLHLNDIDLFYKNELWIHSSINSLPPPIYLSMPQEKLPDKYKNNQHFIELYKILSSQIIIPGIISFSGLTPKVYFSVLKMLKDTNVITQNEGKFELIGETKLKKLGLICNKTIICKLSVNISALNNFCYINKNNTNHRTLTVTVSYLTSYEHMGLMKIWIDDQYIINKNNITTTSFKIIDTLWDNESSLSQSVILSVNCNKFINKFLYLHIQIVNATPQRLENKIKLLGINTFSFTQ